MKTIDFEMLCTYARSFSQLDDAKIASLQAIQPDISPKLGAVTEDFYQRLTAIPKVSVFLEGRMETLQRTHLNWLQELFTSSYDAAYTEKIYRIGHVHVQQALPVEFMAGGMSIIQGLLIGQLREQYAQQPLKLLEALTAINAATGFNLLVMQDSYQQSSLASELERFLGITGMSRELFENLSRAYR
ncbi:MAG: protoglobin domain-containing protein [Thiolinea sp.]